MDIAGSCNKFYEPSTADGQGVGVVELKAPCRARGALVAAAVFAEIVPPHNDIGSHSMSAAAAAKIIFGARLQEYASKAQLFLPVPQTPGYGDFDRHMLVNFELSGHIEHGKQVVGKIGFEPHGIVAAQIAANGMTDVAAPSPVWNEETCREQNSRQQKRPEFGATIVLESGEPAHAAKLHKNYEKSALRTRKSEK